MKTQLTREQSDKLIELGIPVDKQSGRDFNSPYQGVFILTDLLEILPKEIITKNNSYHAFLNMYIIDEMWIAVYEYIAFDSDIVVKNTKELIDALYELLLWAIEERYLKF